MLIIPLTLKNHCEISRMIDVWTFSTCETTCSVTAALTFTDEMAGHLAGAEVDLRKPEPASLMKIGRRLKSSWLQSAPTVLKCQGLLRARAQKIASPPVQKACSNESVLTLHSLIARMDVACPVPGQCESTEVAFQVSDHKA